MAKTKAGAAMLLIAAKSGQMGDELIPVLKFFAGLPGAATSISDDCIRKLTLLEIARKDFDVLGGRDVFLLTPFGKKVVAVMKENPSDFAVEQK